MQEAKDVEEPTTPLVGRLEMLMGVGLVGALSLALGVIALVMPVHKTTTAAIAYDQSGTFSYKGSAPASSIYGTAGLKSGQPIAIDEVRNASVNFAYRLSSKATARLGGTESLVAEVKLGQGLTRQFTLQAPKPFSGSSFTASGPLPLKSMLKFVNASNNALAGTGNSGGTVSIAPRVKVSGTLGGRQIATTYNPPLILALSGTTLTLSPGGSTSLATGTAPSPTATLTPSQPGSIKYRASVDTTFPLLVAHPVVTSVRNVALVLFGVCVVLCLLLGRPLLRGGTEANERDRVRALYGSLIVPVRELATPGAAVADVASMSSLAELAKRYESMIMHRRREDSDEYMVWDNGMLYRYTVRAAGSSASVADPVSAADPGVRKGARRAAPTADTDVAAPVDDADAATGEPEPIQRLRRGRRRASI